MEDIKKVNIYVGVVGQAYVDKETAYVNLQHANENVGDWEDIINIAEACQARAQIVGENAETVKNEAQSILNDLNEVLGQLDTTSEVYANILALKENLLVNDTDNNPTNGGNIYTANKNIEQINKIIAEIEEILEGARNQKISAEEAVTRYQALYDEAVAIFNSFVPQDPTSDLDQSDILEQVYRDRLDTISDELDAAQATNEAIHQTSNEVLHAANEILNGDPEQPEDPEHPNNYFLGLTNINKTIWTVSDFNAYSASPLTELTTPGITKDNPFIILIHPESWGTLDNVTLNGLTGSPWSYNHGWITSLPAGYKACVARIDGEEHITNMTWI